jgi:deoxyribose-phosphate aldolase
MAYNKDIEPSIKPGQLKGQVEASRNANGEADDKYLQTLAKYNCEVDEAAVREAVKQLIIEKVPANDTLEVKKFLHRQRREHLGHGGEGKPL